MNRNKVCCILFSPFLPRRKYHITDYYYDPPQRKGGNGDGNKFGNHKRERGAGPAKGERGNYASVTTENALYERFYKESNVVPEEEWEGFWGALKRTLPTTFRFTGSRWFFGTLSRGIVLRRLTCVR